MNAAANYTEWVLQTLLELTGKGNVFENGSDAIGHVRYNVLTECYEAGMTQYEAARYYKELELFWDASESDWEDFMKPREWIAKRKAKMLQNEKPHVCACGGRCHQKKEKTYHIGELIVAAIIAGLIGFVCGYAL